MTDEERKQEGAEEQIEDLEAPAKEQDDVVGGAGECGAKTLSCDPTIRRV